jgi:small subunit ribosomal protein S9
VQKDLGIGTGRRKTSVARVYVRSGGGKITINGKDAGEYFVMPEFIEVVKAPLVVTATLNEFDIVINVFGGGITGQAGACRMGLSRALCKIDENNYASLRANGFLTRDSRMVERKKYGQRGARRRFQFSKR